MCQSYLYGPDGTISNLRNVQLAKQILVNFCKFYKMQLVVQNVEKPDK